VADSDQTRESRLRVSRRNFLKASGAGAVAAAGSLGAIPLSQSKAFAQNGWDHEYDVVVVGSGGAGFAAGITAKSMGSDTVILEKGTYVGGTTLVSGGGMYTPNSRQMNEAGLSDPKEDRLKYMARYSFPHLYQPDEPQLGLDDHDWIMINAYYDTSPEAMAYLEDVGAAKWAMQQIYGRTDGQLNVDYQAQFEEDVQKEGGTLCALDADGNQVGGGQLIAGYQAWAEANDLPVLLGHRAERLILNDAGEVIGLEVAVTEVSGTTEAGSATPEAVASPVASPAPATIQTFRARKGVIFGSGGFSQNHDMMRHLMPGPYYGGCGAPTNEGDFLRMSSAVNAKLGNLYQVWRNEGLWEQVLASPAAYNCIWYYNGDSFLIVNRRGERFTNEHGNYQDRNLAHLDWLGTGATWDNLLGFLIWDNRQQENWATGFPFPTDPTTSPLVMIGDTLEELADKIVERMGTIPQVTKGMELTDDFSEKMVAEVAKFNEYAKAGVDPDFYRGLSPYDQAWNAFPMKLTEWPSADQPNASMYPISDTGPYYAQIVAASAVDTSGGPVINEHGQVLNWDGEPVVGLYGAGNCVACPSVNAYWAGGATLGHAHTWGYAAAKHAHASAGTSE
jgi:3-oxosteroid 1-dehydrogenase